MKDFDELLAKDRKFKVRDEEFTWQDVQPEILTMFEAPANGDDPNSTWNLMDAQILLFLDSADAARWKKLRKRKENPVTIAQLTGILEWLMEEQTGRPTEQPSPSASGRGRTVPSSGAA